MPKKYIASISVIDVEDQKVINHYEVKVSGVLEATLHCNTKTLLNLGELDFIISDMRLNREDG